MRYHFIKEAYAPAWMRYTRHLAELLDGLTGLIMASFGRSGTSFTAGMCEKILRWQCNNRRKQRN